MAAHLKEEKKKQKQQKDIEDADIVIPSPLVAPAVESANIPNFEAKKVEEKAARAKPPTLQLDGLLKVDNKDQKMASGKVEMKEASPGLD